MTFDPLDILRRKSSQTQKTPTTTYNHPMRIWSRNFSLKIMNSFDDFKHFSVIRILVTYIYRFPSTYILNI